MSYKIVVNGVVREFELFAPRGWQYWIKEVLDTLGRDGLPLLIALHGTQAVRRPPNGGFVHQWDFEPILNDSGAPLIDRFFVLVPYGMSYLSAGVGIPLRGWNSGLGAGYLSVQDDLAVINAMVAAVEAMLEAGLEEVYGPSHGYVPIDEDRRFLFGYSSGAMMCYALAHEQPDYFAAIYVIAGSYGGKAHDGFTSLVEHTCTGTTYGISLYALHGDLDISCPMGTLGTATGTIISSQSRQSFIDVGMSSSDAEAQAGSFRPLQASLDEFISYNSLSTASPDVVSGPDLAGNNPGTSTKTSWPGGGTTNPEVVVYWDPTAGHSLTEGDDRYRFPSGVWAFLKTHPRV